MRATHYAGIAALAVSLAAWTVPVAGQSLPPGARPDPELSRRQLELAARALAKIAVKPKVVCGMTVVPADPKVDPKAIAPVPDRRTKSTIRQVTPGACR